MSLCGVSVGVSLVCLGVAILDQVDARTHEGVAKHGQTVYISDAVAASSKDVLTSSGVGFLAKQFVRKNSQKRIEDEYTFAAGAPLGVGAFGVVRRAVHNRTGIERAVKAIDKEGFGDHAMLRQEVEALRLTDHPNVCRLVEYFESEKHFWLVMELCRGKELCEKVFDSPAGIPEVEVASHMFQMLRATSHCHSKHLVHRDLKPENFIFCGSEVSSGGDVLKLIDFGYSVADPGGSQAGKGWKSSGGTLMYQSPQTLQGAAPSQSDDVWSLGVIFYILLTGHFPFSTNDDHFFQELVDQGRLGKDVQEQLSLMSASPEASDLAKKLLALDPTDRITAERALSHPFLKRLQSPEKPLDAQEVHRRCAQFLTSCRLRRLAIVALTQLLDESRGDCSRTRATFLELDRTGSGRVSFAEFQRFLGSQGADVQASRLADLAPTGPAQQLTKKSEGIGYTAFAAATLDDREATSDRRLCRVVFDLMDADHDGVVSAEDLRARLGLPRTDCALALQEALCDVGAHVLQAAAADPPPAPEMDFDAFMRLMEQRPEHRARERPQGSTPLQVMRDPSILDARPHVFRHDGSVGRAYMNAA